MGDETQLELEKSNEDLLKISLLGNKTFEHQFRRLTAQWAKVILRMFTASLELFGTNFVSIESFQTNWFLFSYVFYFLFNSFF